MREAGYFRQFHGAGGSDAILFLAWVVILGAFYGIIFGMMGAGGSLILKPIMYFGFGVTPFKHAIYNAFLVLFFLAGYGAARGHSKGNVVWKHAVALGVCVSGVGAMAGSYVASMISSRVQLLFFALLITCAAMYMLLPARRAAKGTEGPESFGDVHQDEPVFSISAALVSVVIGFFCGVTGVGGGFMLVPVLTHMGHTMVKSVPTSQAVICCTSGLGFFYYALFNGFGVQEIHAVLCLSLLAVSAAGLACSDTLASTMSERARKVGFACCLILIVVFTVLTDPCCNSLFDS